MLVTTLDPGGTTGVVVASVQEATVTLHPWQAKLSPKGLYDRLCVVEPDYVICEDFEFRPKSPVGLVMTSAHLIGVAMLYCEERAVPLRMQNAAYAKTGFYSKIDNMKKAGVYVGGANYEHAMDAMRHFMQWFYFGPGYQYNKKPQVELIR